jgi:hypothetical protein
MNKYILNSTQLNSTQLNSTRSKWVLVVTLLLGFIASMQAQWTTTRFPSEFSVNSIEVGKKPDVPNAWINTYSDNCFNLPPPNPDNPPFMPAMTPTNHILMRQFGNMDGYYKPSDFYSAPPIDCKLTTDYIFKTDLLYSALHLDGVDYNGNQNRYLSFWEQHMEVHQPTFFYNNIIANANLNVNGTFTVNTFNTSNLTAYNATIDNLTVNNRPTFNAGIKINNSSLEITDASNNVVWNLTPNGKLGMGVTTAEMVGPYRLWVKSGILTERLKIALKTTFDWSDFVFDKSYKLKPLSEVELYIKTNKHLPGIPSAEDMVKTGLDVQEIEAKLLQKIEELTLYVIQQEKDIKELKSLLKAKK